MSQVSSTSDTTKNKKSSPWDPTNPNMYSGAQVNSRQSFENGIFTIEGWFNVDSQPTVAEVSLKSVQPNPIYYPEIAKYWRQVDQNWKYVPHTKEPFPEALTCIGVFPMATCSPQAGTTELTDDNRAKIIGTLSKHNDIKNWQQLVSQTRGLNSAELLKSVASLEKFDSVKKWSDLILKLQGTTDQFAKILGNFLQPIDDSSWIHLVNQMKTMLSQEMGKRATSALGHSDVLDFVVLGSKIIELSKSEFARQVGVALKLSEPVTSLNDLANKIIALPIETIQSFPDALIPQIGIGKAVAGDDNATWSKLAPVIKSLSPFVFQQEINNLISINNDLSKSAFLNWEQYILNVVAGVVGVTVTDKITNFKQLYNAVSALSDEAFITQIAKAIGYTPDVTNWESLLKDSNTTPPYWTAGENWPIIEGNPAPNTDKFMTLDFIRTPAGMHTIKGLYNEKDASFIPSVSSTISGYAISNKQYITGSDKGKSTYDPKELHSYTTMMTPDGIAFFIDTDGSDGRKPPVKTFDYSRDIRGYSGGDKKFW
jgi:hypothetical protein